MAAPAQHSGRAFRHRFEGPFFRGLLLGGLRHIPPPLQRLSMPLWAGLFCAALPAARRAARGNLDQVLGPAPPWRRHWRGFRLFLNYAQMLADVYGLHLGRPIPTVSQGREHLLGALREGRGVIALSGHLGLWQLAPFLAQTHDLPPFVMAMAEEPDPRVQAFEARLRGRFRVLYTTASPLATLEMLAVLRRGEILGMQMDRHLGSHLAPFPFCGRPAWFPLGPATLARLSGAPLVPTFFVAQPEGPGRRRGAVQLVEAPIYVRQSGDRDRDVLEATARVVAVYERYVRRYPRQWFHFFDFWREPGPLAAGPRRRPAGR